VTMIHQSAYWFQIQFRDTNRLLARVEEVMDKLGIRYVRTSLCRDRQKEQLTVNYDSNGPKNKFDSLQEQLIALNGIDGIQINKQ